MERTTFAGKALYNDTLRRREEILAKAAPIRTKLGSQASHRRIAEIFHGKSGVRFFGQVPPPRRLTHPHHTPAPRPHPYTPTSRSQQCRPRVQCPHKHFSCPRV